MLKLHLWLTRLYSLKSIRYPCLQNWKKNESWWCWNFENKNQVMMTVGKLQIWLFLWIPMFWFKVRKNRPSGYESQSTSYKYTAAWQRKRKKYNARTSAERSNKREKIDFKLESGRHRSTKMWYCRLYHILMLQHLDAWNLPFEFPSESWFWM